MKPIRVLTMDNENIWVVPANVAAYKYHPDDKRPSCGVLFLSGGKELFLTLNSFEQTLREINGTVEA